MINIHKGHPNDYGQQIGDHLTNEEHLVVRLMQI